MIADVLNIFGFGLPFIVPGLLVGFAALHYRVVRARSFWFTTTVIVFLSAAVAAVVFPHIIPATIDSTYCRVNL